MTAPASATAAATRKAVCIPLANVAWLMSVITPATRRGVLAVTGAAPTETALFTWASCPSLSVGSPAACQETGSRLPIRANITAPSTAVPSVPPTCMAVDCRPPATPASSTGALPTMTSVAPTITGLSPRPSSRNQTMVSSGLEVALSSDKPNRPPRPASSRSRSAAAGPPGRSPAQEEPLAAARNALQVSLRELSGGQGLPNYLSAMRLIEATPTLLAAYLRYAHDQDDKIIEVLARRRGRRPAHRPPSPGAGRRDRRAGVPVRPGMAGRGQPGPRRDGRHLRRLRRRGRPRAIRPLGR